MNDPARRRRRRRGRAKRIEAAIPRIDAHALERQPSPRDDVAPSPTERRLHRRADVHSAEQAALALQTWPARSRAAIRAGKRPAHEIDRRAVRTSCKDREDYDAGRFAEKLAAVRRAV